MYVLKAVALGIKPFSDNPCVAKKEKSKYPGLGLKDVGLPCEDELVHPVRLVGNDRASRHLRQVAAA